MGTLAFLSDGLHTVAIVHALLDDACRRLDLRLHALDDAARFSGEQIAEARRFFRDHVGNNHELDIVVCGSMARHEMSSASDFDYLVLAHGLVQDATRFRTFRVACDDWCVRRTMEPPGSTDLFGQVVSAAQLVEQIGLEFDTNASLTRRILLLEEGVSVLEPAMHRRFVSVILGRYLLDEDAPRPPGFLLNDVVRYWRTIAVDYQAKVWRDLSVDGWGLRYLKLRISRKLTYVSALVSIFLVALEQPRDARDFLVQQFVDVPALGRIAQLARVLDGHAQALADLRRMLEIADEFCEFLHDRDARAAAKQVTPAKRTTDARFAHMRSASSELQGCLERIFFGATPLASLSRRYLAF
jgi:hypothetical protein